MGFHTGRFFCFQAEEGLRGVAVTGVQTCALPILPGLIDSHVRCFQSGNLYTRPDVADCNAWMPYGTEVGRNKARLPATFKVWLASGVTSVVDIGGPVWNFQMRDAAGGGSPAPPRAGAGPPPSTVARREGRLRGPPLIKIT